MKQMSWLLFCMMFVAPLRADDLMGTVTTAAGEPLRDVRVDISTAGPKIGRGMFCPSCYLDCGKWAKTDAAGNFVIKSLDPSLKFHLIATAPGKKTEQTDWVDPATDKVNIQLEDFPDVDAAHRLLGQVVDINGVAIPGALVSPTGAVTAEKRLGGTVRGASSTVTDDRGHFQMLLTETFVSLDVEVLADGSSGLLAKALIPGETMHELKVPTGTSVTGHLAANGKPAAHQPVSVVQMYRGGDDLFINAMFAKSDADGKFEFKHLPADQPYVVFTPRGVPSTGLCFRTAMFQAKKDDEAFDLGTLELTAGFKLSGQFIMDDSTEFPSGLQLSVNRNPAWDLIEIPIDDHGRFDLDNLPQEAYTLGFRSKEWVIDETKANYHLTEEQRFVWGLTRDTSSLEIRLRRLRDDELPLGRVFPPATDPVRGNQSLSGQVVDRSGKPVAGIRVSPQRALFDSGLRNFRPVDTRSDGKFVFAGLPDQNIIIASYDPKVRGYVTSPQGVKINYMGRARTSLNQKDVRIVYDRDIFMELPEIK